MINNAAEATSKSTTKRPYKRRKTNNAVDVNEESNQSILLDEQNTTNVNDENLNKVETNLRIKIIKEDDHKTPFQQFLTHVQKLLQRKDINGFFAYPVTDTLAPDYSSVISKPMDFHTMHIKIEKGIYNTFTEYKNDYKLMLYNCMKYNHPDSIYHKDALRLLVIGNKYMSKDRVTQMKRSLSFMLELTKHQLGHDDDISLISPIKKHKSKDKKQKIGDVEILEKVEQAAKEANKMLQTKSPNDGIGFIRLNQNGTAIFTFLNPDNGGIISENERIIRLGEVVGDVKDGTDQLMRLYEDRRNLIYPVNDSKYEAFGSFLPTYDSSESNLSKNDSELLCSVYGNEEGLQYAHSIKNFVANTNDYVISMVDELLDVLTNGDHSKYMKGDLTAMDNIKPQSQQSSSIINTNSNNMDDFDLRLQQTTELLLELHRLQADRLSLPSVPPNTECNLKEIFQQELKIAGDLTSQLKSLVEGTNPCEVISMDALHRAMGIELSEDMFNLHQTNQNDVDDIFNHPPANREASEAIFNHPLTDQSVSDGNNVAQSIIPSDDNMYIIDDGRGLILNTVDEGRGLIDDGNIVIGGANLSTDYNGRDVCELVDGERLSMRHLNSNFIEGGADEMQSTSGGHTFNIQRESVGGASSTNVANHRRDNLQQRANFNLDNLQQVNIQSMQLSEQQLAEQNEAVVFLNELDSNNDVDCQMILDECIAP